MTMSGLPTILMTTTAFYHFNHSVSVGEYGCTIFSTLPCQQRQTSAFIRHSDQPLS